MVLKKQKLEIIPSAIHFVLLGTEITLQKCFENYWYLEVR